MDSLSQGTSHKTIEPRPVLRIRFLDFHRHLPQSELYFRRLLAAQYVLDEAASPDVVLYSNYGRRHREYACQRIFYSMENERADYRVCDQALTFDRIESERHYRLPYFVPHCNLHELTNRGVRRQHLSSKTEFCAFVHSNPFGRVRNRLLDKLSRYKPVRSGGRFRNNVGGPVADKAAFLRRAKFAFAFENDAWPGYTTEKLVDALLADTIPIYWGDQCVGEDFNSQRFLHRQDFSSDEALIKRIIELDNDDELYWSYLQQPCFAENCVPDRFSDAAVLKQLTGWITADVTPVARRSVRRLDGVRQSISPPAWARRARRLARHSVKGFRLATGL